MKRATLSERAERIATAKALCQEQSGAESARRLVDQYGISLAQAWRYVRAVENDSSLAHAETTEPLNVRIPATLLMQLRERATRTGLSLGVLVSQALAKWLSNNDAS